MNPEKPVSVQPSRLGLGTGMLGTFGSSANVREVAALLDAMSKHGINLIDTADTYGSGKAERLIGEGMRGRRERFFLMTKAGYRYGNLPWPLRAGNPFVKKVLHRLGRPQCFQAAYLECCLKRSLERLRTDRVDVFLLHDPTMADIEGLDFLKRIEHFRKCGFTGELGISSGEPEVIQGALSGGVVRYIQCPANLADASRLIDTWNECERQGVTIVANHVMGRGSFELPDLTHEVRMRAAAALLPRTSVILCGTRNPTHLIQASQWVKEPLDETTAVNLLNHVKCVIA